MPKAKYTPEERKIVLRENGKRHAAENLANGVNKKRYCVKCGVQLHPKLVKKGKHKGKPYYTKNCYECGKNAMRENARILARTRDYDLIRKHMTRACVNCGKLFSVKGLNNSGTKKTCSEECVSAIQSKVGRKHASANLTANVHKGWIKTFEREQTKESVKLGATNHGSKPFSLIDPRGITHNGVGLTGFIRDNEHLFASEDVDWVPSSKASKVQDAGFKPSESTGCLTCRAKGGLMAVNNGRRKSWKGWIGSY